MKHIDSKHQKYLIPIVGLVCSGIILSFLLSERLRLGHCNKSNHKLCSDPETVLIDNVEYKTCKHAKKLNSNKYSDYLKYTIIPIVLFIIIVSIIFLAHRLLIKEDKLMKDIFLILPIVFLIICNVLLILMYYVFRNICLNNNYDCELKSKLIINDNLLGHTEYTCKSNTIINYLTTHKVNHVIYSIMLFILLIVIYEFEYQFDIFNLGTNKFTDKIHILLYGFVSLILFVVNLLFPNTYFQYLVNAIIAILFLGTLISYGYFS